MSDWMMRYQRSSGWLKAPACFLFTALLAAADQAEQLQGALQKAMDQSGAPGVAAAVFNTENILAQAELGVRQAGKARKIGPDDLWHIGSDGKAITATLVARLVEAKKLTWETTVEEVFGSSARKFHPTARATTIRQLLNHTAGLPPNPSRELRVAAQQAGARSIRKQRIKVVEEALSEKPRSVPGTQFLYSNTGYIIAGAMVEETLGTTWEKAIEKEVFQPLGIESAGFGAPEGASQPRGHVTNPQGARSPVDDGYAGDNPAIYGPAGGLHLSLADWVRFLQDQMRGHQGQGKLLKQASYRELHRPALDGYAMGWLVSKDGATLSHDGSNTYWYATVSLHLDAGLGTVVLANDAGPATGAALRRAASAIRTAGE